MGLAPWHTIWNSNSNSNSNSESNSDTDNTNSDNDEAPISASSIWKAQPLMVSSATIR
jgi:hypothetical protein